MSRKGRAVVAGGAGFIGSHVCERLLREDHEVVCADNLLTGRLVNVEHLLPDARFSLLQGDVSRGVDVEGPVTHVLNLASPASPKDYTRHPIETLRAGAVGTEQTLELARSTGAVYLLASTSEVYGDPEVNPQPEAYWGHVNSVGPRSCYDEAKRYAEALTMAYHRCHSLDVRIARIFNTYGPRMRLDDGRALPEFMGQALRGEPITVYGDGSQTRSFCYVDDLVEGLYRLLMMAPHGVSLNGEPPVVNLGNPEEVSILQIAREVAALAGSRSPIVFRPLPEDDPKQRRPDISRARRILGWAPKMPRQEGFRRSLEYFRAAIQQPASGRVG